MASRASLDLEGGHVQFAARRVRVRALDERGHVQVGDDDGPVLRPATFGERTRLVTSALGSAHPARRLAAAMVTALRTRAGTCDTTAERVVALLLAGAGEAGPSLVDSACLVARASGTPLDVVESLQATNVDFYARRLTSDSPDDDGWHRVVLAEAAPDAASAAEADDDAVVMELAEVLLDRARAWGSAELREAATGTGANDGFQTPSNNGANVLGNHSVPDESAVEFGDDVAPDEESDAAIPRRQVHDAESSRDTLSMTASDATTPASAPLLRFRPSPPKAATSRMPKGDAATGDLGRANASSIGESASIPAAPSVARPSSDRVDWQPTQWNPGPWRLDRRERSALTCDPSGAPRLGAGWPAASPNAMMAASVAASVVSARSAEELADAVAESLRREATRRGLVP